MGCLWNTARSPQGLQATPLEYLHPKAHSLPQACLWALLHSTAMQPQSNTRIRPSLGCSVNSRDCWGASPALQLGSANSTCLKGQWKSPVRSRAASRGTICRRVVVPSSKVSAPETWEPHPLPPSLYSVPAMPPWERTCLRAPQAPQTRESPCSVESSFPMGWDQRLAFSLTDFIFSFSLKITFNIYFPAVYKLTSSLHKSGMLCFFKLQAE